MQLKSIGITDVLSFPFPTSPLVEAIQKAQTNLSYLGALESLPLSNSSNSTAMSSLDILNKLNKSMVVHINQELIERIRTQQVIQKVSEIGLLMAKFPLNPRFSKILITAYHASQQQLLTSQKLSKKTNNNTNNSNNSNNSIDHQILQSRIMQFVLSLVAVLSERSPFLTDNNHKHDSIKDDNDDDDSALDEDDEDNATSM